MIYSVTDTTMLDDSDCLMAGCTEQSVKVFCKKHLLEPQMNLYKFRETSNNYKTRFYNFLYIKDHYNINEKLNTI
jgi:hypothetical protein